MRRLIVVGAVALFFTAGAGAVAQEARPGPGPGGPMGPGGHGGGHGPMMGQGGMMGMRGMGRDHLEHLMVHDPKAAARIMRFRADMLRAISDVLQKHAAELDKAP